MGYGYNPRALFPSFSKTISVSSGSASTTASTLVAGVTGWTIYVTNIEVSVTQDGATALKVQDSTGSVIFVHVVSPGLVRQSADFGENGIACTEGYGLQYVNTTAATAFACKAVVEGYMRQTSPVTVAAHQSGVMP
jgi:hypothetical protein